MSKKRALNFLSSNFVIYFSSLSFPLKDYFSKNSEQYAQFRPEYPNEIFKYISSLVKEPGIAWDVATGNGQVANGLSPYFKKIFPPKFEFQVKWDAEQLLGFLGTWSAVQHYKDKLQKDPIDEIREQIR